MASFFFGIQSDAHNGDEGLIGENGFTVHKLPLAPPTRKNQEGLVNVRPGPAVLHQVASG